MRVYVYCVNRFKSAKTDRVYAGIRVNLGQDPSADPTRFRGEVIADQEIDPALFDKFQTLPAHYEIETGQRFDAFTKKLLSVVVKAELAEASVLPSATTPVKTAAAGK